VSTWEIVAVVIVAIVALFFLGGVAGARARARKQAPTFEGNVRAADEALERARAADRGWHRESMEATARAAISESRPGWAFDDLQLVLVDDRPGTEEDRAHFVASGGEGQAKVVLAREGDRWIAESVD
jgi:type II secretory pathway pseudopilin PulG